MHAAEMPDFSLSLDSTAASVITLKKGDVYLVPEKRPDFAEPLGIEVMRWT
jgi:hypothetical protein